jgi:hypothetical protein
LFRTRWATRLALIGYVGLLETSLLAPGGRAGVAGAEFFELRTGARVRTVGFALAVYALLETLRFLPMGVFAVPFLPQTRSVRLRMLRLAAIAGAVSLIMAVVVLVLEAADLSEDIQDAELRARYGRRRPSLPLPRSSGASGNARPTGP